MPKPLPPFKMLDDMFEISESSPSGLIWKNPKSTKLKAGDVAGTKNKEGYWNVGIKLKNKTTLFSVHRIIYYLTTKNNIDHLFIDHIDRNPSNNTINNLRCATNQQNSFNAIKTKLSTSNYKGVSWDKKRKKWRAQITINYKKIYLGSFKEETDAAMAYSKAAQFYQGSFAVLNND